MKVRVRQPVVLFLPGSEFGYTPRRDEYFEDTDPLVVAHPWAFAPDSELASEDRSPVESVRVEQATASPGERRNARKP